jgi:hypothetical protein
LSQKSDENPRRTWFPFSTCIHFCVTTTGRQAGRLAGVVSPELGCV